MQVSKNRVVAFDYTLTNPAGEVMDTSQGGEPLAYVHGLGGIIPGLETALEGRSTGERLSVVVPPALGYGEPDEGMIQMVSIKAFGGAPNVVPGAEFAGQTPAGPRTIKVLAVEGDQVRIDANHPLAGQTLHFDVTIVSVREATAEEITHGHAHEPGGHHHQ